MSDSFAVRRYNWSNGASRINRWFRIIKAIRASTTPLRLLLSRRPSNSVFYMPANAGVAIFYNVLAVATARLRGYRCVIHHHYFRYLERFDWRIHLLTKVLGSGGLQLVLCPEMERRFRRFYGETTPIAIVPSTIQLLRSEFGPSASGEAVTSRNATFRLGHMSNLQMAKGLDLVLEVFRKLRREKRNVSLILAGPIDTAVEERLINAAKQEFGTYFEYRGPIYREAKQQFYEDINVSIYPTRNDAQPLVVTEALAFSKPIITTARGCIPDLVGGRDGWAIPTNVDYVAPAVKQIEDWIDNPNSYAADCKLARERYAHLTADAAMSLQDFCSWVGGKPVDGFVRRASMEMQSC